MKQSVTHHLQHSFSNPQNWKHTPQFLKLSLFSLLDIVKLNCSSIRELEKQLPTRASKNQVAGLTTSKLSVSDFPLLFERYSSERSMTANINRVEYEVRAKVEEIGRRVGMVQQLAGEMAEYDDRINQLQSKLQQLESTHCQSLLHSITQKLLLKPDRSQLDNLCKLNSLFQHELQQLSKSMMEFSRSPLAQSKINEQLLIRITQQEKLLQIVSETHETFGRRMQTEMVGLREGLERVEEREERDGEEKEKRKWKEIVNEIERRVVGIGREVERVGRMVEGNREKLEGMEGKGNEMVMRLKLELEKETERIALFENELQMTSRRLQQSQKTSSSLTLTIPTLTQKLFTVQSKLTHLQKLQQQPQQPQQQLLSKYITKPELQALLTHKLDLTQYLQAQQNTLHRQQFFSSITPLIEKYQLLITKIDQLKDQFSNFKSNQSRLNDSLSKQIDNRVSNSDFRKILQKLATVSDLKHLSSQLSKKLSSTVQHQQFTKFLQDQSAINQTLCSENITARWLWNTGGLKNGNLIPWQRQIINTLPQNFNWEENTTAIVVHTSGLYKIQMGFYGRKKPTVQIIVNGVTVISAVNSGSYVVHHSSGKLKEVRANKENKENNKGEKQVSGLTMVDYLLLPGKARLAISYVGEGVGEGAGEGFLSLRRL